MNVVIIGAGASGLACAIRLKQNNPSLDVTVTERLPSPAKKILATGNGRCNLSNVDAEHRKEVIEFFNGIGLREKYEDGRAYPYSNRAATVAQILTDECARLGVKIVTDCPAEKIDKDLTVTAGGEKYSADFVVVATGGKAQSALGSNGSGYALLQGLGHKITPLAPALVQLTSSSKYPRKLKGLRVKGNMQILLDGECAGSEYGEILFTDYGLSGIVTMNLSETVSRNFALESPKKCHAVIDLASDFTEDELARHIEKFGSLAGILGYDLAAIIDKQADGDARKAAKFAKNQRLIITGTKGYDFAQITSGGADLSQFDGFASRLVKNLHACGEVLDRQFKCGGYNLNFAFYSGIAVADEITKNHH